MHDTHTHFTIDGRTYTGAIRHVKFVSDHNWFGSKTVTLELDHVCVSAAGPVAPASSPVPFDPTKPVRTRDGCKARIICTNSKANGAETILALVSLNSGSEILHSYFPSGAYIAHGSSPYDLLNIPEHPALSEDAISAAVTSWMDDHINHRVFNSCTAMRAAMRRAIEAALDYRSAK